MFGIPCQKIRGDFDSSQILSQINHIILREMFLKDMVLSEGSM